MPDFPITTNDRYFTATAIAAQTVFTPDFPLFTEAEVIVTRTRAGVTTTFVLTTDYTITGLNQQAGFTCTLTAGAQAGDVLEFFGNTKLERLADYPASQALQSAALNGDLDRALLRDQEHARALDRAVLLTKAEIDGGTSRLVPSYEASKILQWHASERKLVNGTLLPGPEGPQGPPGAPGTGSGDVVGPGSAVSGNIAVFSGSTGKIIADGGIAPGALLARAGGTMTGKLTTVASASGNAGLNMPHGAAPSAPLDGDFWSTTAAFFGRINGTTVQLSVVGHTHAQSDVTNLTSDLAAKVAKAGDTMTGKLTTVASASGNAGLNIPHGAAPSAPVNGDFWSTTAAFFGRINGTTVQLVPTSITLTASTGLTGGGDLSANRSFSIDKASDANVRAAAADKVMTTDRISSASAAVALSAGTSVAVDWASGINFTLAPVQNFTLSNPTNVQAGTWRTVKITQDGTGSRVLTLGSNYKAAGGGASIVLSTAANAVDFLSLYAESTTNIYVFMGKGMAA